MISALNLLCRKKFSFYTQFHVTLQGFCEKECINLIYGLPKIIKNSQRLLQISGICVI